MPRPCAPPPDPGSRDLPASSLHLQLSCRPPHQPYLGPDLSRGGHFADQLLGPLLLRFTVGWILSRSRSGWGNRAGPSGRSSRRVVLAARPGHPLWFLRGTQQCPEGLWSAAGLCPSVQAPRLAGAIFRGPGRSALGTGDHTPPLTRPPAPLHASRLRTQTWDVLGLLPQGIRPAPN